MEYVKFKNLQQNKFMKEVKIKSNKTWDKIATNHKRSKSMIFKYLAEDNLMSKSLFLEFSKYYNIDIKNYKMNFIEIKNKEKKIKIPKESLNFAEFLGALNGDGHLDDNPYEMCIVSEKVLDNYYISKRIPKLIKSLFNLNTTIYIQNNLIRARVYSKRLVMFINNKYNVPIGKKLNKLKIPGFILKNKEFQIHYLRGLFDTDGTFYGRRNNEPILGYTSLDNDYIESIKDLLNSNGFNFNRTGKDLYLYNKLEISRFFQIIRPQNHKHLIKYKIFKKTRKILKTAELYKYLIKNKCTDRDSNPD